jgi:hypothetical protein
VAVARQWADRAAEAELALRQHQQRRAGWLEANAHLGPAYRQVMRELAWQRRAAGLAAEHDPPAYLREELGPVPESIRGRRAWRQAAAAIEDYRRSYQITDPTKRSVRCRMSRPSGAPGTKPAPPPSASKSGSAPPTVRNGPQPPAQDPLPAASATKPAPHSSGQQHAGLARSGPPASSSRRPAMPRPHPSQPNHDPDRGWPSCDHEQPGVWIRPLGHADLQALLAHLDHHDQDERPRTGPGSRRPARGRPVLVVRVRASIGRPGA